MLRTSKIFWLWITLLPAFSSAADLWQHDLQISLQPEAHRFTAKDTITLPRPLSHAKTFRFLLHTGLNVQALTPKAVLEKVPVAPAAPRGRAEEYMIAVPMGAKEIVLEYGGEIYHPLQQQNEDYARRSSDSPGMIDAQGVFLSQSSFWYPQIGDGLLSFSLDVQLPEDWQAVSQGARTRNEVHERVRHVRWEETHPQDEIYLIASRYSEYERATGAVQGLVFLRSADEALAQKYLDATDQYIDLYSQLLGPYPYAKFALVENFWETGYGMPSFTLLGSKVIRLPFIVYSSYPHEILHNWWGNGVYVAYEKGNWSEGLTSYLADHLLAEQRGDGVQYRRATLQKYTDFVSSGRDFPLSEFRSRHSSATEAVGYGKTLMLFHMLRLELGDALFVQALREFYRQYQFRVAGFDDIKRVFNASAQKKLDDAFDPWVLRAGAPALRVSEARAQPEGDGFKLTAHIEQIQKGPAFPLVLPVAVTLQGQDQAHQTRVAMNGKSLTLTLRVPARPMRLDVDPEFDVFRRLDRNEIPPALSAVFGAQKATIVLPAAAPAEVRNAYRQLAQSWQQAEPEGIQIVSDDKIKNLPKDRSVWIFGWENRWRGKVAEALRGYDAAITEAGVRVNKDTLERARHGVVLSTRHPGNAEAGIGWLAVDNAAWLPAVGRKLPHYARYSYLGFEGVQANNIVKGQWPVVASPLSVTVKQPSGGSVHAAPVALAPRRALTEPGLKPDAPRTSGH